jgi:hypothetical protein
MAFHVVQPRPIDVTGMLRRASNRVHLRSLYRHHGDRHMRIISPELLDRLITQAITETIRRLRDEGAMSLAMTESRLASESRKELNAILHKLRDPASTGEPEVFFADDEEKDRGVLPFNGTELERGRGLDFGSANISASAWSIAAGRVLLNVQRNAFVEVRADGFTQSLLNKFGIDCIIRGERAYVLGDLAFELATIFDKAIRRPLKGGASEPDGAFLVRYLLERILGRPQKPGEICVYSIPGEPVDGDRNFIYYLGVLEDAVRQLGYTPRPMLESHVIIRDEFRESSYTGLGLTCGGTTFNVCLACKGVPALSFSTPRGGEWVDQSVAKAIGMPVAQVTAVKERGMHLFHPQDHVEAAISIYYRHLLQYTVETIQRKFSASDAIPSFNAPIDIVCAGGSATIGGFIEMFAEELQKVTLPVELAGVRLAQNPVEAVATGCLKAALDESRALQQTQIEMTPAVSERAAMTTTAPPPRPSWFGKAG